MKLSPLEVAFRRYLVRRGVVFTRACSDACPGFFLNADTGRWERCDDCALLAPRTEPAYYDEDVRAFVKRTYASWRAGNPAMRLVVAQLALLSGRFPRINPRASE